MSRLKTLCLSLVVLLTTFVFVANSLAASAPSAQSNSLIVTKIAAVVNGEMVTLYDVQAGANSELMRLGISASDPRYPRALPEIMRRVLDNKINDLLLRQEANRLKILVTETEIDNELRKFIQRTQLSGEEFDKELAAKGENVTMVRDKLRDNILTQRIISFMISRKVVVPKEEINSFYESNKDRYVKDKVVDVSILVFSPKSDAKKLSADIKAGKLKFVDAVAKYSVGPAPDKGGQMGKLPWNEMALDWKKVLTPMKPGDVSDIFDMRNMKCIVKLNSLVAGTPMTVDEARMQIEEELRTPLLEARFQEYVTQLRNKAVVDIKL